MSHSRVCVAVIASFGAGATIAADVTAYGFELGKPLPLSECRRLPIRAMPNYKPPYATVTEPCLKPANMVMGEIAFPTSMGAKHAAGGNLGYGLADGTLQVLVVPTAGAPVQSAVMADLVAKYGPPTSSTIERVTSAAGAVIDAHRATWALDTVRVEFFGVVGRVDMGRVLIGTHAGVLERMQLLERVLPAKPL